MSIIYTSSVNILGFYDENLFGNKNIYLFLYTHLREIENHFRYSTCEFYLLTTETKYSQTLAVFFSRLFHSLCKYDLFNIFSDTFSFPFESYQTFISERTSFLNVP